VPPHSSFGRWLLVTGIAVHVLAAAICARLSPIPDRDAGDLDRYYEIASTPGRPYVDYQVEYPVGTLMVFKGLALMPGGRTSFGLGVIGLDLLADAIIIASLVWGWGVPAAAVFVWAVAPMIHLVFLRMDAWSTAAATVAVAAWRRDRPVAPGVALVIGGAFKLWPLVLTPLLVVPRHADRSAPLWRLAPALRATIVTATLACGMALMLAGASSVLQVLTFRGARGWQIESLVGNLLQVSGSRSIRLESGSIRIGATSGPIIIAMAAMAAPLCLWSSWRGARTKRVGSGWLAAVSSLQLLSPLLSPQFLIWLIPAAGIAWKEGDRQSGLLAALAVVCSLGFMVQYDDVLASRMSAVLVITLRNGALIAVALSAVWRLITTPLAGDDRKQ
jgi:hypothetical protein